MSKLLQTKQGSKRASSKTYMYMYYQGVFSILIDMNVEFLLNALSTSQKRPIAYFNFPMLFLNSCLNLALYFSINQDTFDHMYIPSVYSALS